LGINWTANSAQANADPAIGLTVNAPASAVGVLTLATLQNNLRINAQIQALVNEQKANILSSPRITTQDNQAASIDTTDSITYQTSTITQGTGSTVVNTTYNQLAVPISLRVTPQINMENNDIRMLINFVVASATGQAAAGAPPNVSTQTATTQVKVKNGETAAIGGLMRDRLVETENKVPLLGDIPLLGMLFKSRVVSQQKKELVILLTPTIVED
jgi:type IV pilus assembly protein PilQ